MKTNTMTLRNKFHLFSNFRFVSGVGGFHALLLLTSGLCLMATIVETLNIGFVIPLIEMECELNLSLTEKGLLNSSAFVGQFST